MFRDYIHLSINGQLHKVSGKYAFLPLSDLLRYEMRLTGTKIVCAEGDCGACTVMLTKPFQTDQVFQSLNSCISTAFLLDGCQIVTIEGLAEGSAPEKKLTEVQSSMVRNFGGQCGFCTPGFVMSITNMYETKAQPTEQNVKNYLTGNLCRCTGYTPIIHAALDVDQSKLKPLCQKHDFKSLGGKIAPDLTRPIKITFEDKEFFAPTSLQEAALYKKQNPDARIFSGATDIGVQINKGRSPGHKMMSLHLIKELYNVGLDGEWITVGARVSLTALQKFTEDKAPEFSEFLNIFASPQIKNAGTLIGNVANGSPIGDTTPYLLTADAIVKLLSASGVREVPLVEFIKGYRSLDLREDELITEIRFKKLLQKKIALYKISQRRDLDISAVNSSFVFHIEKNKILEARIALGGVGPKVLRLTGVESALKGQTLDSKFVETTRDLIEKNITPISDVRGSADFRKKLCQDLFTRFAKEHLNT